MRKRSVGTYRRVFLETNGPGPWPCFGCGEPVVKLEVHHLDEDPTNDSPENLVAMHNPCHISLHQRGRTLSLVTRARVGDALRGKPKTEEHRRKLSEVSRGKPNPQRKQRCGECAMVSTGSGIAKHQQSTGHTGHVMIAPDDLERWLIPSEVKCQFCDNREHLFEVSASLKRTFLCGEHIGSFIATWTVDHRMTVVRL
jgi:hypothetical protein